MRWQAWRDALSESCEIVYTKVGQTFNGATATARAVAKRNGFTKERPDKSFAGVHFLDEEGNGMIFCPEGVDPNQLGAGSA